MRLGYTSSKRWGGEVIGNIYENPNLLKEEE
ncbi:MULTISPECIES: YopX family protein [unclassified Clostridium]